LVVLASREPAHPEHGLTFSLTADDLPHSPTGAVATRLDPLLCDVEHAPITCNMQVIFDILLAACK
jgi:hypothetical protein